jgi:uncharacterized membrane protein HdeD (DUF308 family)
MIPSDRHPRLHLVSGLAFLMAGLLFLRLGATQAGAHRLASQVAGALLLLAALLQVLAARRKRRA